MINLLSEQYKEELKNIKKYKIILIIEMLFAFFLISLFLFLFLIKIYIKEKTIETDIVLKTKNENFQILNLKNKELKEKIIPINKTLSDLSVFYTNQISIIEIIKNFPTPPPEISLNAFLFDKSSSFLALTIFGNALTRESLIQFKNNIEEKKEFSEVYIPWSDLLESENINFTITFKKYPKK